MIAVRPVSTKLPFPTSSVANSDMDNMHISPTAMLAIKIYAFGGLAFMMGIILFALGVWVWTVIIKREWANSPPDLELHPEVSFCLSALSSFLPNFSSFFLIR